MRDLRGLIDDWSASSQLKVVEGADFLDEGVSEGSCFGA
jgi:hypothetical protein